VQMENRSSQIVQMFESLQWALAMLKVARGQGKENTILINRVCGCVKERAATVDDET
jgi:hypothetical protein